MTGTAPMLKAAGLWRKISAKGVEYFAGQLGGIKVIFLENRDRKGENEPSHHLCFVDGEKPRVAAMDQGRPAATARSYANRRDSQRPTGRPLILAGQSG